MAVRTAVLRSKCHAFSGARRSFAKRGAFQEPHLAIDNAHYNKKRRDCQGLLKDLRQKVFIIDILFLRVMRKWALS